MSVEQRQNAVNSLDKEIADLEKKKADADKKAADEEKRAASVYISKNPSPSTLSSKQREIENHKNNARKALAASAELQKKIAEKRKRRNEAYLQLQREEQYERKRQEKQISDMSKRYEERIAELEKQRMPVLKDESDGQEAEYDVFVSHAWEDKKSFVDDFVNALREKEIKVWYDTTEIKWGNSMRAQIDEGLKRSKFGIVVLSPDYIAEGKYWTKAELDGLFQLESTGEKALLPVWHRLSKKEVMSFSPIIANKKAMKTSEMTPEEMAEEFAILLRS